MAKSVLDICSSETVNALATKINQEIDHVCSSKTDTLFKKKCEVDGFSWEGVWHELEEHLPTFYQFWSPSVIGEPLTNL